MPGAVAEAENLAAWFDLLDLIERSEMLRRAGEKPGLQL